MVIPPGVASGFWSAIPTGAATTIQLGFPEYLSAWLRPIGSCAVERRSGWRSLTIGPVRWSGDANTSGIGLAFGSSNPQGEDDRWPIWVGPALALHLSIAGLALLLPATRRRAKVRSGHVGRAAAYGLGWLALLGLYRAVDEAFGVYDAATISSVPGTRWGWASPLTERLLPPLAEVAPRLIGSIIFVYIGLWWLIVIIRYWRLQQAWLVWLVLMFTASIAAWAAYLMFAPI